MVNSLDVSDIRRLRLPEALHTLPGITGDTFAKLMELIADSFQIGLAIGRESMSFSDKSADLLAWTLQPGIVGKLSDKVRDAIASADDEFSICRQILQTIASEADAPFDLKSKIADSCDLAREKYNHDKQQLKAPLVLKIRHK